jgi:hypothetical protein
MIARSKFSFHIFILRALLFSIISSAVIITPAGATTWVLTGSLTTERIRHTATLLPNGKVLAVGGGNIGNTLASAELYEPGTGLWTTTGSMTTARGYYTATLLANGKVLAVGGWDPDTSLATKLAELYDPGTSVWTTTGSMSTTRLRHTATLLPNGKILVVGGYSDTNDAFLTSAELYNPATGVWAATGSMATRRSQHTATLLPNGKVLVAGGFNGGYPPGSVLYDPATGLWTASGAMATARFNHTATLLSNGKVLVAGGENGSGLLDSAELYDPATGVWTSTDSMTATRNYHTASLLPNGQVLVSGGDNDSGVLASAELYDPATGLWTATGSMTVDRYEHTATLLPNGKVLAVGGHDNNNTPHASAELYSAPADIIAPSVSFSVHANPVSASSVDFAVTFNEFVTGVDATDFSLTTTGVTGASISGVSGSGSLYKVTVSTGSGAGTIRLNVLDDNTIIDTASNPLNGAFTTGEVYTIDITAPTVSSSVRTNPSPTSAASVDFTVTFSESVMGVDTSDFSLTTTGVTGATINRVNISESVYTVTVATGSGSGTIRLDVLDDNSILDSASNPLSGTFTSGETYTVNKTLSFNSTASQDGWILESTETSGLGGTMNSAATLLYLGDNTQKKQYRSVLSFNTSSLPDNAVITKVTLKLKRQGVAGGGNPVTAFQGFMVDIKKGTLGTPALALGDFKVNASKTYGPFNTALTSGWYNINLTNGKTYINKLATNSGLTQIRLRFKLDDNNNAIANILKIYSGNAGAVNRPQLVIEYYVP